MHATEATEYTTIVHFKRFCSRHIHKEIKLQKAMNVMDRILCKTDLIVIRRHTYNISTPSAMLILKHFLSPPMNFCGIHNFNKSAFLKGVASSYVMTSI